MPIPPPFACAAVMALLARLINLSLIVTVLELMNVVLPLTVKFPDIIASALMFKLAPLILPVALTCPTVFTLPAMTLPKDDTMPLVTKLAPVMLPEAFTCPLVLTLPLWILPVADI